jgi:hypothetical protein
VLAVVDVLLDGDRRGGRVHGRTLCVDARGGHGHNARVVV